MAIPVKLEVFEGPLDLLLHLIDKNKIDIYDIPIAMITEQYLEYVSRMDKSDMNVVSEFLVMAATLLDIKSRMLLPQEEEEGEEVEDPRAELVEKLLEYKLCKYMSSELRDMQSEAGITFVRKEMLPPEVEAYKPPVDYEELLGDATLAKLNEIFKTMLKRQEDRVDNVRSSFGKIEKEKVDMERKENYLRFFFGANRRCSFRQLLEDQHSKEEIIVTFLIVLEMIKTGDIIVRQNDLFDDIEIEVNA